MSIETKTENTSAQQHMDFYFLKYSIKQL
jgi:hypothetical protein